MEWCPMCTKGTNGMKIVWRQAALILPYVIMGIHSANSQPGEITVGFMPRKNAAAVYDGFLSIDCGSPINYTDSTTGIFWETDEPYISSGVNINNINLASGVYDKTNINRRQLDSLRYFDDPGRGRDCYVLPTEPEQLYLVRPTFFYGNLSGYDSTSSSFWVYINGTRWSGLRYGVGLDRLNAYFSELYFYSVGKVLNFCLVREEGASFISSLELRRLSSGMYSVVRTPLNNRPQFLVPLQRFNYGGSGSTPSTGLRYPDDVFDRIWNPSDGNAVQVRNSSRLSSAVEAQAPDLPPIRVMEDGIVNNSAKHISGFAHDDVALGNIFGIVYCQELDGNSTATNIRGMEFYINSQHIQSFNCSSEAIEVFGTALDIKDTNFNITVTQASWSRLPPLLNAMEFHLLRDFNTSQTAVYDIVALNALQEIFDLTDWNGDPCLPVPYDWISCTVDSNDPDLYRITGLSLHGRRISGSIPNEIFDLENLKNVSLERNNLTGTIPDFSRLRLLQFLSLRENNLDGNIQNLSSLVHLQALYLENNSFTGKIPDFLSSFPNLTELHLDSNQFTGDIPAGLFNKTGLTFTATNNPGLRPRATSTGDSKHSNIGAIVGGLLAGIVGLVIFAVTVWYFATKKKRADTRILKLIRGPRLPHILNQDGGKGGTVPRRPRLGRGGSLQIFSLQQMSNATREFSCQLGEGAFGRVYYGVLSNGQEVAVKVKSGVSHQGEIEFLNELELLSRIHHGNLVSLLGYCEEAGQEILIYAFVPNGTLRDHLYGHNSKIPLNWKTRLNIAVSSAIGLEYLHFHCHPRIIHRDVKSSNILLDKNMIAKVADFGISKETAEGMTSGVDTVLKGTPGYIDPEYFITQRLTQKSDVYSFGIVLLEIITGRHPHPMPLEDGRTLSLLEWVRNSVKEGNALVVFDPAMENKFSCQSARMVLDLALACTNPITSSRPDMCQVVCGLMQASQLAEVEHPMLQNIEDASEGNRESMISCKFQDPCDSPKECQSGGKASTT